MNRSKIVKCLERKLECRLLAVAYAIEARVHCDVGADHAQLTRYLLETGKVQRAIVVEKSDAPFRRVSEALEGYPAEVRRGDGLSVVQPGEIDCLSLSGMGSRKILHVLEAYPDRVPFRVVLQTNSGALQLRRWAQISGFHLLSERLELGYRFYEVVAFERQEGPDPAYRGIPVETALRFGPHLLRRKDPLLVAQLLEQNEYWARLVLRGGPGVQANLTQVRRALELVDP